MLLATIGAPNYDANRFAIGLNTAYDILLLAKDSGYQPSKSKERFSRTAAAMRRLGESLGKVSSEEITMLSNAVVSLDSTGEMPKSPESVAITKVATSAAHHPTAEACEPSVRVPEVGSWLLDLQQRLQIAAIIWQRGTKLLKESKRFNDSPGIKEGRALFYQFLLTEFQRAKLSAGSFSGFSSPSKIEGYYISCPETDFLVEVVKRCPAEMDAILERVQARSRRSGTRKQRSKTDEIYQAVAAVYDRLVKPRIRG
jgi:hypothetical protein